MGCKIPLKPALSLAPQGGRQCELVVRSQFCVKKRRRIAEALPGVASPFSGAKPRVGRLQLQFPPLRRPPQFAGDFFRCQKSFPIAARSIGEPHPCEMKNFVNQNPFEIAVFFEDFPVEQDHPFGNGSRRPMRPERLPNLDADPRPGQRREHPYSGLINCGGPPAFGAVGVTKKSLRSMVGLKRLLTSSSQSVKCFCFSSWTICSWTLLIG